MAAKKVEKKFEKVKRTYSIYRWQDEGFKKLIEGTDLSQDFHVRLALEEYLEKNGIRREEVEKR